MNKFVLDASAVIASINKEPGGEGVFDDAADFILLSVNLAEVVGLLVRQGGTLESARKSIGYLGLQIVDFDRDLAEHAGAMIARTRSLGLSLGDRACLALAARENLPVLTADSGWRGLDLGIEIRFIR